MSNRDPRTVLHADGKFRKVPFQNLDFTGLTGPLAYSTSTMPIETGLHYLVLNDAGENIRAGCVVQVTFRPNPECWGWGLVMAKDTTVAPARIKFALLIPSDITIDNGADWEIQVMSGPLLGFSPDATIGISSDTISLPTEGQIVSANILANKLVSRNVSLLWSDATNAENYFRMRVLSYDGDTGDVEGVCTAQSGSGSASAWIVSLIPGPVSGATAAPTSVTYVDGVIETVNNQSFVQAILPAGILEGDLLVIHILETNTEHSLISIDSVEVATTAVAVGEDQYDVYRTAIVCKIADGTEAGQTLQVNFPTYGSFYFGVAVQVLRPDAPVASFTINDPSAANGTTPSVVINASGGDTPRIVVGVSARNGSGTDLTFSTTADGTLSELAGGSTTFAAAYEIYNSGGADVTISCSSFVQAVVSGAYIELLGTPSEPGDAVVFEDDGSGGPKYPSGDGSAIDLSENTTTPPPWTSISGSLPSAATFDFEFPTGAKKIIGVFSGVSCGTTSRYPLIRFMTDASTTDTTTANYGRGCVIRGATGAWAGVWNLDDLNTANCLGTSVGFGGSTTHNIEIEINLFGLVASYRSLWRASTYGSEGTGLGQKNSFYIGTFPPWGFRLMWHSTGSFDAGDYVITYS